MLSKIIIAVLCTSAVALKPKWQDLGNYTFEKFLTDFNLHYHPSELQSRRATFTAELARVHAHNSKNLSWKEGINKFSALTQQEKKAFHGRSKGVANNQKHMLKNAKSLPENFTIKPVSELPKNVDWRTKGGYFM